ncbi:phage antirepressor N-terminal domain-containing protein [Pseudomonas arsenicoxydans]|uniref:Antirepressor protein ant N-terminal domain-containing protein n=1 Tax=Pseudomonas arsenicoxydans TaxID=702115 RepID=A0A502HRK3_9PSED|nr:phage antirepressor N-terminal domain-containing protein [Pseudomonas arsenicoxydans]TPG76284.1 hypothetical protein EAH78_18130 [Pseudomonas arsenicoxydans]
MQAAQILAVPFRNSELLLVDHDDQPFVPMKPVVEGMGLDWKTQHRKLSSSRFISTMVEKTLVAADGKQRSMTCLPLRKLTGWLMSVHPNKVKPELRAGIMAYQSECDDALWSYWNNQRLQRTQPPTPHQLDPVSYIANQRFLVSYDRDGVPRATPVGFEAIVLDPSDPEQLRHVLMESVPGELLPDLVDACMAQIRKILS